VTIIDIAGIGIGPSNLGLAAMLHKDPLVSSEFFDAQSGIAWHAGLMLPHAEMQTSFLEDLVTPVDPTSRFSYLSYLADTDMMVPFLCRNVDRISRLEFQQYLAWVAAQLDNLSFSSKVLEVRFNSSYFDVFTERRRVKAKHISLGCGRLPKYPEWAAQFRSNNCFHSSEFRWRMKRCNAEQIVVIGGGQSAADIVLSLLSEEYGTFKSIIWLTRRPTLIALDNSPFVNEFHTPQYSAYFNTLSRHTRAETLKSQTYASDGILHSTLEQIYKLIFQRSCGSDCGCDIEVYPSTEAIEMALLGDRYLLNTRNIVTRELVKITATKIILCTGYSNALPDCNAPLEPYLTLLPEGKYQLETNYRVSWSGPSEHRIYAQAAGSHLFGVGDAQLCMTSWRNARIVNDLTGVERYRLTPAPGLVRWQLSSDAAAREHRAPSEVELIDRGQ